MKKLTIVNWLQLAIPGTALALRMANTGTADFSYLVLGGYALLGRAQAIQALALSWLFGMLSEGIAPPLAGMAAIGRYAVIACAAISVLLRGRTLIKGFSISQPLVATLALGAFLILHSLFFSRLPDVSILKAFSWTVVMGTLLSAWGGLYHADRAHLERQLFGGLLVLAIISLPLTINDIGYLRNGTGFQGVLSHPQGFGPTVALLFAWLAGRLLMTSAPSWRDLGLLLLCIVLVVMSESRTAGLGVASVIVISIPLTLILVKLPVRRSMPGLKSRRALMLTLFGTVVMVVYGANLFDKLGNYYYKKSTEAGALRIANESRGQLVEPMVENIKKTPVTGIGFGIASDPGLMDITRDPILGLPTGAAIEKGVLPIAVLEELGIVGFLLVVGWLWFMVGSGFRSGIVLSSVLATLLVMNFSESTFFSPSGFGLFPLILFAWAVTGSKSFTQALDHA